MSYFSEALDAYMTKQSVTNADLAEKTQLNDSEFSRWRRGDRQPTGKAVTKLLESVPDSVALELGICWLRDQCPPKLRQRVAIQAAPGGVVVREELLSDDFKAALAWFEEAGKHNAQVRQVLVGWYKMITKPPTLGNQGTNLSPDDETPTDGEAAGSAPPEEPPQKVTYEKPPRKRRVEGDKP